MMPAITRCAARLRSESSWQIQSPVVIFLFQRLASTVFPRRSRQGRCCFVDLEDAVAPGDKRSARDAIARTPQCAPSVFIRINGPDTEWFEDDLKLCSDLSALGVVIPKSETQDQIRYAGSRVRIRVPLLLPLVEICAGYANWRNFVRRLAFSVSYSAVLISSSILGISREREELLFFRSGWCSRQRLRSFSTCRRRYRRYSRTSSVSERTRFMPNASALVENYVFIRSRSTQ